MNIFARLYYPLRKAWKAVGLYLVIAGPGIVVMVADNDAGGITTYAATGAKYGYHLIWFLLVLIPVAYYVQEMTVRLGAVTKRGHAEAIFDGFGAFWGWFSLLDLMIVDWLTLVTEFVGMTAALAIFGVPPWITVVAVIVLMAVIVLNGRYWTFEKLALLFCALNLVYIPGAFLVHPSVAQVLRQGLIPNFAGGFDGQLFFFLMANIGTTIAPWMLFFQQSAVVDKGMLEKDIPWGRFDTLLGSIVTVVVAVFIVIVTGTVLPGVDIDSAAQAAQELMKTDRYVGTFLAIGSVRCRLARRHLYLARKFLGLRGDLRLGALTQYEDPPGAVVLRDVLSHAHNLRSRRADSAGAAGLDHLVRSGDRRDAAAGGSGVFDLASE